MSNPNFNHDNLACPCKGCAPPTRTLGCHSHCKLYIDWKSENQRKLDKIHQESAARYQFFAGETRRNSQLKQKGLSFGRNKNRNGSR